METQSTNITSSSTKADVILQPWNKRTKTLPISTTYQPVIPRFTNDRQQQFTILTEDAQKAIRMNKIPDLQDFCTELFATFFAPQNSSSAIQFIPVMQKLTHPGPVETSKLLNSLETSLVLVQNDLLKVVLIHWPAGKTSSVHGHPEGGCIFKILKGTLEETRYSTDNSEAVLSVSEYHSGSIAYIDDRIGYHSVRNVSNEPAISIHAYTPGKKASPKK